MCWRTWAMRELAWVKALPHITHWHGFSPGDGAEGAGTYSSSHVPSPTPAPAPLARSPTRVDADVPLQGAGVRELSLAVDAHVRLLSTVDPKVPLKVPWGDRGGGPGVGHHWAAEDRRDGAAGQPWPYLRW